MSTIQPTRVYANHTLDSTRWAGVVPRPDDVVVVTPYKSGTTWTLQLVYELLSLEEEMPSHHEFWVDCRFREPRESFLEGLEALQHRRYLKSHLPFDGIVFHDQLRYVVVGRDPRDVFMSLWNHHRAMIPHLDWMNSVPGRQGPPMPMPPEDIHTFWRDWIGRGWFEWEREGYPFWGNLHHVQSWWEQRHRPNVLLLHFDELHRDLPGVTQRLGAFLGIDVPSEAMDAIRRGTSLDSMREAMAQRDEPFAQAFFRHRGTNGRWRGVLDEDELASLERLAAEMLDPDCRAWLAGGVRVEG